MGSHRAHVKGAGGVTHDVRVWRTATAACKAVVFDPPRNIDTGRSQFINSLERLEFRLICEGQVTEDPVDCMSCLAAPRTPYAVLCDDHGQQFLTAKEYDRQTKRPDVRWHCPMCGESAYWDDDEYEAALNEEGPYDDEVDETDHRADQGR